MMNQIVSQKPGPNFWPGITPGATAIRLSRDHGFYFYSRRDGRDTAVLGERVTASRAKEIIDLHPGGRQIGSSEITFKPGAYQWTWLAEVEG